MRNKFKKTWQPGDKSKVASAAGIGRAYFSDILADRKVCHPDLAGRLEDACYALGYNIPRIVWAFSSYRQQDKYSAFFPKQ